MYKAFAVEFISRKNANYTSNNELYIKCDNVRIRRIILDLCDVIADSKNIDFFEYEMPLLS